VVRARNAVPHISIRHHIITVCGQSRISNRPVRPDGKTKTFAQGMA